MSVGTRVFPEGVVPIKVPSDQDIVVLYSIEILLVVFNEVGEVGK